VQVLLSQTNQTREQGKEMIQQEQVNPSTVLQSGVMLYEAQKIVNFLETGVMILPSTSRSDWPNTTDEQFEYMLAMHSRLNALHALYNPTASVPQGIDNA
jgi:hypothetical protein